jgi:serpin B
MKILNPLHSISIRIVFLQLSLLSLFGESEAELNEDVTSIVNGNTKFALVLYTKLKQNNQNLFFSPLSISSALAMTYAGAHNNTAAQMAKTLNFTLDKVKLHMAFMKIQSRLNSLSNQKNFNITIANSIWPQKKYPVLKTFSDLLTEYYGVTIVPQDYITNAETARLRINSWVEEKTGNKIKNFLKPGYLNALTRLVLVNAIYYKGIWAFKFKKELTKDRPFYTVSGKSINIPTMVQTGRFKYGDFNTLKILELPYSGNELSMLILLPVDKNGLKKLETDLSVEKLIQWTSNINKQKIRVFLPKFRMMSSNDLSQSLKSMGMIDAFTPGKADFSGIDNEKNNLYISAVIHKGFVEVNEEGSEAAAATAVVTRSLALAEPPPTFKADHPFLFFIRDNSTKCILFWGRMNNPALDYSGDE